MNWNEGRNHVAQARGKQMAVSQVLPASEPSPYVQDYRIHMLLSTLMLLAGLVIANLH